jgi:hypothetical protein
MQAGVSARRRGNLPEKNEIDDPFWFKSGWLSAFFMSDEFGV